MSDKPKPTTHWVNQIQPKSATLQVKCCHGNTITECDGTCTDDTRCTPPTDQPKPTTGEWWTEQDADGYWHIGVGNRGFAELDEATAKAIADAHTAALAAERDTATGYKWQWDKCERELAAERERSKELDEDMVHYSELCDKKDDVIQQLRSQLSDKQQALNLMTTDALNLKKQLAAAQAANDIRLPQHWKKLPTRSQRRAKVKEGK